MDVHIKYIKQSLELALELLPIDLRGNFFMFSSSFFHIPILLHCLLLQPFGCLL